MGLASSLSPFSTLTIPSANATRTTTSSSTVRYLEILAGNLHWLLVKLASVFPEQPRIGFDGFAILTEPQPNQQSLPAFPFADGYDEVGKVWPGVIEIELRWARRNIRVGVIDAEHLQAAFIGIALDFHVGERIDQ